VRGQAKRRNRLCFPLVGSLTLTRAKDKQLILFFSNVCPKEVCDPPKSDFQEYYKVFAKPSGTKKFKLQKKEHSAKNEQSLSIAFFDALFGGHEEVLAHLLSDQNAPCGASGFGQSPGGTEQPVG
jgi:hypothetical protein